MAWNYCQLEIEQKCFAVTVTAVVAAAQIAQLSESYACQLLALVK